MHQLAFGTLGQTWLNLVAVTTQEGSILADGLRECLGVTVSFPAVTGSDSILDRFGDPQMIQEMKRVFFEAGSNALGHSYAKRIEGPGGRSDLTDVVSLLRGQPLSKRAVLTFRGNSDGKVPCINAVQFLVREAAVQTTYFARGQDAFRKFYADGLCLAQMGCKVAEGMDLTAGRVTGFLASSHVYPEDLPAIQQMLSEARVLTETTAPGAR